MKKLSLDTVLERIYKKCKERNYEFLGFCDKDGNDCEWYGNTTYLKLHCNICENDWHSTNYNRLVNMNKGCKKCWRKSKGLGLNVVLTNIIEKCKEKNYEFLGFCNKNGTDCEYKNAYTHLKLHCNICGNNWNTTTYDNLTHNHGCSKCIRKGFSNEEHIEIVKNECKKKNSEFLGFCDKEGNNCDYQKAQTTFLKLHCNTCGNDWNSTTYANFISGKGCPQCKSSKLEEEIRIDFTEKEIDFEFQKKFDWLGKMSLDFYLPQYNIAIECQGIQHFEDNHFTESLQTIQERDQRKKQLCEEHGMKLLYYINLHIDYPYQVFEDKEELLKEIKKN